MTYKDTLFFIGKALTINHIEHNKLIVEEQLKENKIDWDAVVKISTAHFVFPALYCNLKRAKFLKYVPLDLVDYMKRITQINRERNELIIKQAKEINNILLANNITPIFLKGTGNLLEGIYHDIGERMVGDIDLLVKKQDFQKSVSILQIKGYRSEVPYVRTFHWHYPKLTNNSKIASIEVHKKILRDNYDQKLALSLYERVKLIEGNIHVLSNYNQAITSLLPKLINDELYHTKQFSLRNAYDLLLIYSKETFNLNNLTVHSIERKLNNYMFTLKNILNDTDYLFCVENTEAQKYYKSVLLLLENNKVQQKWIYYFSQLIELKIKINTYKYFFTNKVYRNYVLKRLIRE